MYTQELLEKMKEVSAKAFAEKNPLAVTFHSCFDKGVHSTQWRSIVTDEDQLINALEALSAIQSQIPSDQHIALAITEADVIPEHCASFVPMEDEMNNDKH